MGLLAYGDTGWGDELVIATLMTLAVATAAIFIGFLLAAIFASFKLSKIKTLNLIGSFYTTVFRGVPELLVIYLFFFGGSGAVMYVAKIFGYDGYIEINAFITGAISIGIISGAYSTEVFRGAIQSVHRGQFEASEVLGLKKKYYYYKVIIPQMLRLALPNISNVWQITLKDTSLISVTGLVEIMRQSYIAAGSTRDPLFFYSFAAVLYLVLTFFSMKLFNNLEKHYRFEEGKIGIGVTQILGGLVIAFGILDFLLSLGGINITGFLGPVSKFTPIAFCYIGLAMLTTVKGRGY